MPWNYRVMRQTVQGETFYGVHEVYYDDDGKIEGWTQTAVAPLYNETTDPDWSLRQDFERMMKALDLPALDHATGLPV